MLSKLLIAFAVLVNSALGAVGVGQFYYQRPSGEQGWGSAVCVGPTEKGNWCFITARHNLEGVDLSRDRAYVSVRGQWAPVTGFAKHEEDDIALLTVKSGEELNSADYATELPKEGDRIHVAGYTWGKQLRIRYGTWRDGRAYIPEGVDQGDSGCGVFNEGNQVVGVLSGHDIHSKSETVITDCFVIAGWYHARGWPCPSCRPPQQSPHAPPYAPPPPPRYQAPTTPNTPPKITPKDCVTLDDVKRIVNESLNDIEVVQGPKGERGADGQPGGNGTDGRDGLGLARLWVDGTMLKYELTNGEIQDAGHLPVAEYGIKNIWVESNQLWVERADGKREPLTPISKTDESLARRVGDLEHKVEMPFRVQLFNAGQPASEEREVNPHGGYLPLDIFGEFQSVPTN